MNYFMAIVIGSASFTARLHTVFIMNLNFSVPPCEVSSGFNLKGFKYPKARV